MAINNDLICEASRVYRGDKRNLDSHNGRLRAHLKNFGEQGVDLKALKDVSNSIGKMEPDEYVRSLATKLHYARLIMRAEAQSGMFFDEDTRVSNATRYSDDIMTAESRGFEAGKDGKPKDECPYDGPSDMADAWRKWWKKGSDQRAEAKPASKPANASKRTLRGRQMKMAGTEEVQHTPGRRRRRQKAAAPAEPQKKRRGRPPGSKNKTNGPAVIEFPNQQPAA